MPDKIITIAGETNELAIERDGATLRAGDAAVELIAVHGNEAEIRVDGKTHFVPFFTKGEQVSFSFDGEIWSAEVADKSARGRTKAREHSMSAPMPGVVLKILVSPGAVVAKGAPLLILEAMKMEHQIVAPYDGTVRAINCKQGEMVQPGIDLIQIAPQAA